MAKKSAFRKPRRKFARVRACIFCQGTELDWKDFETLKKFTSERGKLLARSKAGACAYHQRRLTSAIKRARHIALLPFKASS